MPLKSNTNYMLHQKKKDFSLAVLLNPDFFQSCVGGREGHDLSGPWKTKK
jgi:hypothetical protein